MKIILSRKGFDSAAGGIPSPILDDGTMLSLPIPSKRSPIRYGDIELHGHDLGRVVEELGAKNVTAKSGAHHDPDLIPSSRPRSRRWRPLFGQADNEQTVLERELVGEGDLFLFFGWCRGLVFRLQTRVSPKFSVKAARLPVTKSFHTSLVAESRCRCMLADC